MFDFHMHSDFSGDCSVSTEDMIIGAIDKGLQTICFTEHIDYEYPDKNFILEFDLAEYCREIAALQEKYKDKIVVKKGIELGVQPHLLDRYEQLMKNEYFDFALCSLHTVKKQDLHSGDFFKDKSNNEAHQIYYEELLYCVQNFTSYNILSHLDFVKRYTVNQKTATDFHEIIREIFKVIIPEGKGIELNTSGTRYGLKGGSPSDDILKLYKNSGGEIITLGSDAHRPEDLAYEFKDSLKRLKGIGFKYISTYDNQKPTFHPINELT